MASMPPGQDNQDTEKQTWCASELKSNEKNRRSWELELWCSLAYGILIGPSKLGSSRIYPTSSMHGAAFLRGLSSSIGDWWMIATEYILDSKPSTQAS